MARTDTADIVTTKGVWQSSTTSSTLMWKRTLSMALSTSKPVPNLPSFPSQRSAYVTLGYPPLRSFSISNYVTFVRISSCATK